MADLIVRAASERGESRGAHFNSDRREWSEAREGRAASCAAP
ncbi:MAG: hypothetical protein OJK14_27170 [Achromobacter sp.]|nr:hypothetical protein [Achromobacter sp.]MCW0210797.1 hypothetical protein [Achromobacter sp.]